MPNGDQHDDRMLWEKVRDMERTLSHARLENSELQDKVKELKTERDALLKVIQLITEK